MINLSSTSDKLQLVSSSTANLDVLASYVDLTTATGAVSADRQATTISTAATTDITAAPGSGVVRNVKTLNVRNRHASSSNTVTVQQVTGAGTFEMLKLTLVAGTTLSYIEGVGWIVVDTTGASIVSVARGNIQLSSPSNPTGTTSTTGLMMGNAVTFTPSNSTRVMVTVTGMAKNNTIGDGASAQLRFGTGSAPANAAALTGTTVGVYKNMIASTAAGVQGFAISVIITGLVLGTTYWFDLGVKAVTGGTATVQDLDYVISEV